MTSALAISNSGWPLLRAAIFRFNQRRLLLESSRRRHGISMFLRILTSVSLGLTCKLFKLLDIVPLFPYPHLYYTTRSTRLHQRTYFFAASGRACFKSNVQEKKSVMNSICYTSRACFKSNVQDYFHEQDFFYAQDLTRGRAKPDRIADCSNF